MKRSRDLTATPDERLGDRTRAWGLVAVVTYCVLAATITGGSIVLPVVLLMVAGVLVRTEYQREAEARRSDALLRDRLVGQPR